jgi:hypothetical protein
MRKWPSVRLADERDQLAGVAEVAHARHARGQVAAQRDDAVAAQRAVQLQQAGDLLARAAHAADVRHAVEAVLLAQLAHGLGV